jgi:hypothetical protein
MSRKPVPISIGEPETVGGKMLAKYRPRASKMTQAEREALIAKGMQLVYGSESTQKTPSRR